MKNKEKLKIMNPFSVTVSLIVLFTIVNAVGVIKATPDATSTSQSTSTSSDPNTEQLCTDGMRPFIAEQTNNYYQFLEQTFQNKDSSSSLVDISTEKYREYRKILTDKWQTYYPQGGQTFAIAGVEPGACRALVDEALSEARMAIQQKATTTAVVKETSALLEKYQSINSELRDLADTVIKFKANLDVFTNKVACFVKSGCTKG